ncbi:MAG: GPP34 family phosphoprotein [Gemmatimonadetes bacterium]|nr:GPP34 family phosphoprotein [Candidatus Palauibacter australiensis]
MSSSRLDLHLHEQLLLLSLRQRNGALDSSALFQTAMGAAILAELASEGWIRIEAGKKGFVEAVDSRSDHVGDEILDEALALVRGSRRRRGTAWISAFAMLKQLTNRTAEGLCNRGILGSEEARTLRIFPSKVYPTVDTDTEHRLITEVSEAVTGDGEVDLRPGIIVSLAHATGLLGSRFEYSTSGPPRARRRAIAAGKHLVETAHAALHIHRWVRKSVITSRLMLAAGAMALLTFIITLLDRFNIGF